MKTWAKRALIGIVGAGIVVGGLTACANRHDWHGQTMSAEDSEKFRTRMVERVGKRLDLDAAQKQKLAALGDRLHEQRLAMVGATPDPRTQLQALVSGAQFDRAKAQLLVTEKLDVLRSGNPAVIAAVGDFYDSLNPQQQQKVRDLMQHRGRWFNHG